MEQNICKPTIGNMLSKWNTLIHFEFDFNDLELRFIQTHESNRVERQRMHKPLFLQRMGIKAAVTQPNHGWLAEFCVVALPLFMLVHTMLCDASCGISRMCMTMMILRDLPHTCTCTWCYIQRDSGNKIMALLVLRTRDLQNLFKLNINLTMRLLWRSSGDLPAGLCLMSKAGHGEYLPR